LQNFSWSDVGADAGERRLTPFSQPGQWAKGIGSKLLEGWAGEVADGNISKLSKGKLPSLHVHGRMQN